MKLDNILFQLRTSLTLKDGRLYILEKDGTFSDKYLLLSDISTQIKGAAFLESLDVNADVVYCNQYTQSGTLTFANTFSNGANSWLYVPIITDGSAINFPSTPLVNEYASDIALYGLLIYYDGYNEQYSFYKIADVDSTPPTLDIKVVEDASKSTLNLGFSESVNITTAGWTINTDGAALSIVSVTDSGTSIPYFTLSRDIVFGESITLDYDSVTGTTEDLAGNELVTFTGSVVTNNVASTSEIASFQRAFDWSSYGVAITANQIVSDSVVTLVQHETTKEIDVSKDFEIEFTWDGSGASEWWCSLGIAKSVYNEIQHVIGILGSSIEINTGKDRLSIITSGVDIDNTHLYRIQHDSVTPSIIFKYSTDGGLNWIVLQTLVGANYLFNPGDKARFRNFANVGTLDNVTLYGDWEIPTNTVNSISSGIYPDKIGILCTETLDDTIVPATTDFAVSGGKTVTNVEIKDKVCIVTVDSAYTSGDSITVAYTQGANIIQSLEGSEIATFGATAVTNEIGNTEDAVLENTPGSNTAGTTIVGNSVTFDSASVNDTIRSTTTVNKTSDFNIYFESTSLKPSGNNLQIYASLTVNTAINGAPLEFIFGKIYVFSTDNFCTGASRNTPSSSKFEITDAFVCRIFNDSSANLVYFMISIDDGFTWNIIRTLSNSTMDAVVSLNAYGDASGGNSDSLNNIKLSSNFA